MSAYVLLPAAFPALVFAHFVALLSPGQDFFLIVAHSVRYRLRGSRYICVGIAIGNAVYIAIAILGWTTIRSNTVIFSVIETLGAIYLVWIGFKLMKSQPYETISDAEVLKLAPSVTRQLLLGLNSALLNPKNALFYMSLMVVILGREVSVLQQVSCGVWMFLAVLLWDLFIAAIIGRPRVQTYLKQCIHLIERGAGFVLICFGVSLFLS
ncbi:LysE family translocator [Vibrio salinus]|uniref:LysE family translocator n=1 Tax=Vibrio salinus TaxID=2899784 RepID=UPI001E621E4F|nr:LysE family transporter [Vibrio salinus]MCE0494994.1 LysE family translocator [Vibrio salinus]